MKKLIKFYSNSKKFQCINEDLKEKNQIYVSGLIGSKRSFFVNSIFEANKGSTIYVLDNREKAAYHFNDLQKISRKTPLFLPASFRKGFDVDMLDNNSVMLRCEVLNKLNLDNKEIIVTYSDALIEKVLDKKNISSKTFLLKKNDNISLDFVNETLFELNFKRVDYVSEPGEFALRGGLIDVFSYSNDKPYRIEFFGNKIDSIRTFDVVNQCSIEYLNEVSVLANIQDKSDINSRQPILSFTNKDCIFLFENIDSTIESFEKANQKFFEKNCSLENNLNNIFTDTRKFKLELKKFKCIYLNKKNKNSIDFNCLPQPNFKKDFKLFVNHLNNNHASEIRNYIFCSSNSQKKRLTKIINELSDNTKFKCIVNPLYQGFIDNDENLSCYTDHQLFERYHKFRLKNGYSNKQAISIKVLSQLSVGDYITHFDYGIGVYGGLQTIEINKKKHEALKILYGERDLLYVSIHSLHKISKFNGKDGSKPKIYKLGSNSWNKLKEKAKSKVKEVAFNLIKTYAKRKMKKGFACESDSYLQDELEASFMFEDTPDQKTATIEVKKDMEKNIPMDRLICGDVGFGKTEVAIRAAFKAADNGMQVAVLVPTTILAFQHYNTFKNRLKNFPININYINRFKSKKEKIEILNDLKNGKVDIIIGTHKIVSSDVDFKKLGLLIVDEEQKFGVGVKEKLRSIKEEIDVLTLTATPIPRTLQFSLMAARDLSIINTPPPNRYPIDSQVIKWNESLISDAINYELNREGQIFFVHNRVDNITEIAFFLQKIAPSAKIGIAHGKLNGNRLEEVMLNFMSAKFDILVATSIIENGLDVPNANTIFINNSQNFGLSDLHQMRGRVGRSNKKAFCFFIIPGFTNLTKDASKRMEAVSQYTALGSGFQIAMRDLEIRGAGDILGGEQSGFINEIGFDTYQKILNEAVDELKENEFNDFYKTHQRKKHEIIFETDLEVYFPSSYINNISERLNLYQQLSKISNHNKLEQFSKILIDRFGPLPSETIELFKSVKLKWLASSLGFEKIILKKSKCISIFNEDYIKNITELALANLLKRIGKIKELAIKEKNNKNGKKFMVVIDNVDSVSKATKLLKEILINLDE